MIITHLQLPGLTSFGQACLSVPITSFILETGLIKAVYIIVRNAIIGFGVLYQLEPCANYLWILLVLSNNPLHD
jgi:hypothetical protein